MKKYKCQQCQKEFNGSLATKDKFCSRKCFHLHYSGNNNPMKRLEIRKKASLARIGMKFSNQHKKHISDAQKRIGNRPPILFGEKNSRWKGGITSLYFQISTSYKYRQWRSDVLTRDNFTCQKCGKKEKLRVHHIKEFSKILKEYNIKTRIRAFDCEELWNINNGITYCQKCHIKHHYE